MDDAAFGAVLADLLERSHHTAPAELAALVRGAAQAIGLDDAAVYLADVQQTHLVPYPTDGPSTAEEPTPEAALRMEGTFAGWAYRTESLRLSTDDGLVLWLPLIDGIERIGVLRVTAAALDAPTIARCRTLASVTALIVISKSSIGDTVPRMVRTRPMTLQAELAWAFMPPRTLGTSEVTSSAVLEPAYEIGGDAFDHSLDARNLHLAVVDAMGHDVASGLSSSLALAGYRSSRRLGAGLADIVDAVDRALARWVPDRLLTAVFATLDLATGRLSWVNCGHPAPLLIRRQHVVPAALTRPAHLPLGLGPLYPAPAPHLHHAQLEPGDRILVHTDGVTEGRSRTGEMFGEPRLVDTVVRATAAGEPTPEALHRLVRTILDHQSGRLTDDATILLAEWHPTGGRSQQGM
ncbi:PP2C family protein-serine/threonine phosphatase [Kitasatospora camelliae]|uniref:PP2C family protein-serine/threonine phosphatase n=1 Tax=Kitasatospora camelliae TaxID=3156397 RepID=A0AAU8JPQ3_9ACTN